MYFNEFLYWIECIIFNGDFYNSINNMLVKDNGIKIYQSYPQLYQLILKYSSYMDEKYYDFSFTDRINYILKRYNRLKHLKIKIDVDSLDDLIFWIEHYLFNIKGKLKQSYLRNNAIRIYNKWPDIYYKIIELTEFLDNNCTFIQRIWHIYNKDFENKYCKYCGEVLTRFQGFQIGYSNFCSKKCASSHEETLYKCKRTKKERHGNENFTNKPKQQETYYQKTGYKTPLENPEVKNQIRLDNLNSRGVEWVTQDPIVMEKILERKKSNTGYIIHTQDPVAFKKMQEKYYQKTGYKNPLENPEVRKKSEYFYEKNWGVTHNMHVPEIAEKVQDYRWHDYQLPSGEWIKLQGYEPQAFAELLYFYNEKEILHKRSDMPEIWYFNPEDEQYHRYYPDFYIPRDNLIIEVKSEYTYMIDFELNKLKEKATKDKGYLFETKVIK